MVLELTKPSQSNLGMLKVLLSSNTPQLLEGARVTLLASSQEDRDNHYSCVAQQPSMEKGNDQDNHTPVVTEIDDRPSYESVLPEHLPQKPTSALPDSVRAACRSHHACVIAGPVQCKDVCGLMKLSASFSLFHPSLGVPGLQRYLLLVELNVEGTTGEESSSTKGKSPLTLTVSFHQLQAQPPKNYKSFVSLRVSTTFIQQLALTACRLRVREEEFSGLCVEAREWLESSHVRSHVLSEEDRFKAVELLCILAGRLLFIHSRYGGAYSCIALYISQVWDRYSCITLYMYVLHWYGGGRDIRILAYVTLYTSLIWGYIFLRNSVYFTGVGRYSCITLYTTLHGLTCFPQ